MKFQKITAMALAVLMLASLAACGAAKTDTPKTPDQAVTAPSDAVVAPPADDAGLIGDSTQIPNPWTDYDTVEDAASAAGFDLTAPAAIAGEAQSAWRVMTGDKTIFEVRYGDGVILRKAAGTGDISGDYSDYSESQEIETGGVTVTARGSDGAVHCAVWEAGGSTFSLTSDDGLTADEVAAIAGEAQSAWRVMTGDKTIFGVRYGDGVILRKAAGTGDISGDYSDYSESQEIETGGVTVTARGSDGAVHCAVWEAGGSTFSLTSDDGLTADEVAAIAAEIA